MGLSARRRGLMGQESGGSQFPLYLYNEGEISSVAGDFTTDGYKYGADSNYEQSKQPEYLGIKSKNSFEYKGGRTFTTQYQIPNSCIGKTLRVIGTQTNTGNTSSTDMRNSFARVYVSSQVVNNSEVQAVADSGCFVDAIYANQAINGKNKTINIDLTLTLTQAGYVSVMAYKGYGGWLDVKISKIWIE